MATLLVAVVFNSIVNRDLSRVTSLGHYFDHPFFLNLFMYGGDIFALVVRKLFLKYQSKHQNFVLGKISIDDHDNNHDDNHSNNHVDSNNNKPAINPLFYTINALIDLVVSVLTIFTYILVSIINITEAEPNVFIVCICIMSIV